jgi:uncharacterized protein YidB (DUF937 family)
MGLLDSVIGSVLNGALGQGQSQPSQHAGGNAGLLTALLPVVLAMLQGQQSGGGGGGLGGLLGGMLGGGHSGAAGNLGALLEQFQKAGLGQQAASWVGTGQNQPISAADIGKVFGNDKLAEIAKQAGVSHSDASAGLAQLLPQLVDQLTPKGELQPNQIEAGLGSLLQSLGRR